jgi:hypothetical protein
MVTKRTSNSEPARKRAPKKRTSTSIWDELAAIGDKVPKEAWEGVPRDLARNFDHYLDGSPRQD